METTTRIWLWFVMVWLLGTAWADNLPPTKTKPPYERLLKSEDERTAAELEKRISDLEEADQCAEAVRVAEQLAALRDRVQGPDHWQACDARNRVHTLKRVAALPAAGRAKCREANHATRQADAYHLKEQNADAQPLYERAVAIFREHLGEDHLATALAANRQYIANA